jgi:8-amino-7-oxononanoate synthase
MLDSHTYPIARWGAERVRARNIPVQRFRHHRPDHLERLLRGRRRVRPIVVSDGVCPDCGRLTPLPALQRVARRHGGLVVLDDTQSLGLFGEGITGDRPWGGGGGGTPAAYGSDAANVVVVSSLAKAFGAPLAALLGPHEVVERFAKLSETREHSSAPTAADLAAGMRALRFNATRGDATRARLVRRIRLFRAALAEGGLSVAGGLFPIQTLADIDGSRAAALHECLERREVRTVLRTGRAGRGRISFVITARHSTRDLLRAADAVIDAVRGAPRLRPGAASTGGNDHVDDS